MLTLSKFTITNPHLDFTEDYYKGKTSDLKVLYSKHIQLAASILVWFLYMKITTQCLFRYI